MIYSNADFIYESETGGLIHARFKSGRAQMYGPCTISVNSRGYRQAYYQGRLVLQHRLIWFMVYGYWPDQSDHINGIKVDNRLINLRDGDIWTSARNMPRRWDNTSGVTGVCWDKRSIKWRAYLGDEKKVIHIGLFEDFNDAVAARKQAERIYGFHENHGRG